MTVANEAIFWKNVLVWMIKGAEDLVQRPARRGDTRLRLREQVEEWLADKDLRQIPKYDIRSAININQAGTWTLNLPARRQVIVLPSPENGRPLVPVISLKASFDNGAAADPKMLIALFTLDSAQKLQSLGYRVEPPTHPGDGGSHDFFHVQHIIDFDGTPLPTPEWIPDSQPSIPVPAQTGADLLICGAFLIYGFRGARLVSQKGGTEGVCTGIMVRATA